MPTPTEHVRRDYAAFLRGPAGSNTYAFTSTSDPDLCTRAGVFHAPQMAAFPAPSDTAPDDFGIIAGTTFDVEIFDEQTDDDWPLLDSNGDFLLADDGSGQLVQDY